ncbi:cytochrome P450 [Daedalea quercina L-15889]|uniref:Cytochrome P450 n=1 Tax=Daedalea quercina L-15889 TaxID=1314783 RepID=A0A165QEU1_9APHY|nr:cytochrome P450 [Daedalea quercina L-15889]
MAVTTACAVATLALCILCSIYLRRSKRNDLPPGPPRLPILGNVHQLPLRDQHKTFREWASSYGDIVYTEFLTKPVIIVSSAKVAYDLMEKRGVKYSSRPRFVRIVEMIDWSRNVAFRKNDDTWRRHRKWYQQAFIARSAVNGYQPLQLREVRRLLHDLLQNPSDFTAGFKRYIASLVFEIGYGRTTASLDGDDFIRLVDPGIAEVLSGSSSGTAPVDLFPILKYVPTWMPGAEFRRRIVSAGKAIAATEDIPYNMVQNDMTTDVAQPSFASNLIQECSRKGAFTEKDESDVKGAMGTLYIGEAPSPSVAAIIAFVLAMVQNPGIYKKAQEEMASVVGDTKLPDFEDRESLPYLENIIREVYRWCPPVPTAVPHQSDDDDIYRDFYIPKGSMIIPNIWAMFRDSEVYPDPEAFKPERYLSMNLNEDFDLRDPRRIVFGFGRRICPGRFFADNNVWLAAASIVATMDISKARDEQGNEIMPAPKWLSGLSVHLEPFACDIRPRSEKSQQLIVDSIMND